jgi:hypothetical protein
MACGGGSLPFVVMAAFQKRFSSSSNARKSWNLFKWSLIETVTKWIIGQHLDFCII